MNNPKACPFCLMPLYYEKATNYRDCLVCGIRVCSSCASGGLCLYHFTMLSERKQKKAKLINGIFEVWPIILIIPTIIFIVFMTVRSFLDILMEQNVIQPDNMTIIFMVAFYILVIVFLPFFVLVYPSRFLSKFWIKHLWINDTGQNLPNTDDPLTEILNSDFKDIIKELREKRNMMRQS